jgi:hypothetical protein
MPTRRTVRVSIAAPLLFLMCLVTAPLAAADTHVRPLSPALQQVLDEGVLRSQEFRALVAALEASDVIVYLKLVPFEDKLLDGQLLFLGAGKDQRYLMVSVAADRSHGAHLSIVAHELRHALEIAAAPSVVSAESMGRYYDDVGYRVPGPPHLRRYDTRAAIDTGRRVFDEVLAHATAAERAEWVEWVTAPSGRQ